ncbi:MAG: rhomboid family intramembrane serine protease [Deltaproteobacteria bacterium]|nr:rhomboid family intramembrane serine protease [Deltaproteobacteria bacterium]
MIPYKDLNQTHHVPWMTILLISINIFVFGLQLLLPLEASKELLYRYAIIPYEFKVGPPPVITLFTSMFLHGGFFHIGSNLLYLWIFGDNIEDRLGPFRFLFFYLLCGLIAAFAQIYSDFDSRLPALGASGAIAGVLGAYLFLFPRAKVMILVPIFYFFRTIILPAWLVLGGWVLLQLIQVYGPTRASTGIALYAHLGGFVAGLLLLPAFKKRSRR